MFFLLCTTKRVRDSESKKKRVKSPRIFFKNRYVTKAGERERNKPKGKQNPNLEDLLIDRKKRGIKISFLLVYIMYQSIWMGDSEILQREVYI